MADHGPFDMASPAMEHLTLLAGEYLEACKAATEEQFAGRTLEPASVKGASVMERSAISIGIQSMVQAREAAGIHPFNFVDGVAHGMAAWFAQGSVEAALASMDVLDRNTRGYEARTRVAMNQKGPLNG
jgi:hypothetical protein